MRLRLAAVFALLAVPAAAEDYWEWKDWRLERVEGRCAIWAGGDGDGAFRLEFGAGGFDPAALYEPVAYNTEPLPLELTDSLALLIDGRDDGFGDELFVFETEDPFDGRPVRAASLTAGFVPDLVAALREGGRVAFVVFREGREARVYDDLSLAGFTAVYLKAAEWCGFAPEALPRS